MLRAVRGATTIEKDEPQLIRDALAELLARLQELNGLEESRIISVFVSVTQDIHSTSPARLVRQITGWNRAAILSVLEPDTQGMPCLCIRLLIQFEEERSADIRHIYLREAKQLRPDLTEL